MFYDHFSARSLLAKLGLNDQCVSFTINFEFIDLAICKNKRKDYKIKVFRFFTKIKYALFSYRSSLRILEYIIFLRSDSEHHDWLPQRDEHTFSYVAAA